MARLTTSVKAYFRHTHGKVLQLCAGYVHDPAPERLHELRVNLKRIRFIRSLMKRYGSHKSTNLFRPYIRIFREAGEIRSHQMNRYRLTGHLNRPDDQERTLVRRLCHRLPRFVKKINRQAAALEQALGDTRFPAPTAFIITLAKRVQTRMVPDIAADELHAGRRRLKELMYGAEIAPATEKKINRLFNMTEVAALEDKIGDWHDLVLTLHSTKLPPAKRKKLTAQKKAKRVQINQILRRGLAR